MYSTEILVTNKIFYRLLLSAVARFFFFSLRLSIFQAVPLTVFLSLDLHSLPPFPFLYSLSPFHFLCLSVGLSLSLSRSFGSLTISLMVSKLSCNFVPLSNLYDVVIFGTKICYTFSVCIVCVCTRCGSSSNSYVSFSHIYLLCEFTLILMRCRFTDSN